MSPSGNLLILSGYNLGTAGSCSWKNILKKTLKPFSSTKYLRFLRCRVKRNSLRVLGKGFRQDFQSHFALELVVAGAIDLTHAACAQMAQDFIVVQPSARRESHSLTPAGGQPVGLSSHLAYRKGLLLDKGF